MVDKIGEIEINEIKEDPHNARKHYSDEGINLLAESISVEGLINPLIVVKNKKGYIVADGHRRFRAIKKLGHKKVACVIRNTCEKEAIQLATNILKEKYTDLEQSEKLREALMMIPHVGEDYMLFLEDLEKTKVATNDEEKTIVRLLKASGISVNSAIQHLGVLELDEPIKKSLDAASMGGDDAIGAGEIVNWMLSFVFACGLTFVIAATTGILFIFGPLLFFPLFSLILVAIGIG